MIRTPTGKIIKWLRYKYFRINGEYYSNRTDSVTILSSSIVVLIAILLSSFKCYLQSGIIFIILGVFLYCLYYKTTKNLLNSRGLFLVVWLLAIGMSAMKIHPFQTDWKPLTWICIWISIVFLIEGYKLSRFISIKRISIYCGSFDEFKLIISISLVISFVFVLETICAGMIPIFSSNMSAYRSFGLPYLHYITVSCVLIPPFSIIYIFNHISASLLRKTILILVSGIMLMIPILIVSRQLLMLGIIFAALTVLELIDTSKIPIKGVVFISALVMCAWFFLSQSRNQNEEYLKYVFCLDDKMSVSNYQTYMYFAFNIDNFNDAVGHFEKNSVFLYSLEPLLTLTGTKGLFSKCMSNEIPEAFLPAFNTYSFLLTPYRDLGVIGVLLYSFSIGILTGYIEKNLLKSRNNKNLLFHIVTNYCLIFSFFSSFFSITTIWVYYIIIYLYDVLSVTPLKRKGLYDS